MLAVVMGGGLQTPCCGNAVPELSNYTFTLAHCMLFFFLEKLGILFYMQRKIVEAYKVWTQRTPTILFSLLEENKAASNRTENLPR